MRIPGLELREPLKPRPISGALYGAGTGALFTLLGHQTFVAQSEFVSRALGYVGGGFISGLLVGASLPMFRKRWLAGGVVSAIASVGFFFMFRSWAQSISLGNTVFLGLAFGFTYATLFWDYQPEDETHV